MGLIIGQSCSLALRRGSKSRKIPSETGLHTCPGPGFLDDGSAKLQWRKWMLVLSLHVGKNIFSHPVQNGTKSKERYENLRER